MVYVGIPTVNLKDYLIETIGSIQTKYPWKLFLVDNGSVDGTQEWISEESGYEHVLNGENLGVAKAWNQILYWALSHNDPDVVFILNNDIVLHPEAMDRMIETVLEGGKGGVSGVAIGNDPVMLLHCTRPEPRYSPAMNFCCFGLTRSTITRVGVFDEGFKLAYFEDNDYHHRMQLDGIDASSDLWAPFSHYGSRTIREGGVNIHAAFRTNREYFRQKWGFVP